MEFLLLIVIGIIYGFSSLSHDAKVKRNVERMEAQGAFLPRDYQRDNILFQEYLQNWVYDGGTLIPKEYHEYFHQNPKAVAIYCIALAQEQQIKEGLSPTMCPGTYNKFTYDPFRTFKSNYEEKIKLYEETGRVYF